MVDSTRDIHSRYSFNTIFSDICKTRFNNMVVRFFLNFIFLESLLITLVSEYNSSFMQGLMLFFPKFLALYFTSIGLIITRKNWLHIKALGYSTFVTQVFGQLCSFKFISYYVTFMASSMLIGYSISDNMLFDSLNGLDVDYYRSYAWFLIPLLYTSQHVFFDLDKLAFGIDSQHQAPQQYIAMRLQKTLIKCIVLVLAVMFCSPFLYGLLGWSIILPFVLQFKLLILSFLIFFQLEFINLTFNAHMSIGCLHKGKPISSLSPTPIETLVSGLSSKKSFTKLTAFQELSYRSTFRDTSLRLPIYSNPYRNSNLWANILSECLSVIQTTNESVNQYLNTLENTITPLKNSQNNRNRQHDVHNEADLFGNKPNFIPMERSTEFPGNINNSTDNDITSHRISLHDEDILLDRRQQRRTQDYPNSDSMKFSNKLDSQRNYNDPLVTRDPKLIVVIKTLLNKTTKAIISFFFPSNSPNGNKQQQLSLFEVWYLSKERQAEKLVPLATCHMESVVSLMGFLVNAIDESPKGSVVASVGEVLKHLERSVAILGKYAEWNPDRSKNPDDLDENNNNKSTDVISLLYELSISAFLEIVLKYNVLLNDVYLDEDVIKLSKWVLDMCADE